MPVDGDQLSVPLPDVIRGWSFANQSNHDGLLSAIPAVLALLLKTISSSIEFRKFGTQLCEALLHRDQIRLFDRGLTANKSKSHLFTPCLRLLTEIVSFDGGRLARTVYTQRDVTFKRLDVFLSMRDQPPKPVRGRLKHSVRHIALIYLLSNFRFQGKNVKAEILSESKLVRALFQGLSEDPPNLISEILNSVMNFIMRDDLLSKRSKSRLLTDWSLAQISRLYEYSDESTDVESESSVQAKAHSFLMSVCTSLDHGVLVQQDGWYPPGLNENTKNSSEPSLAIASSKLGFQDRYTETVPVRNVVLASFLQVLRPYANVHHKRLLLAVFAVAPELIADYFYKKKNFSFDSKLSATWVGYSSFLFSVIRSLPPPALHDSPPPVAIALESILPHPMNQKVLTRCLTQTTELITFLAVRLLIAAFQKMESILRSWAHREGAHWTRAASLLKTRFCQRCPELKHVITAFRTLPEEKGILRESLLRLLAFYYKVTPGAALIEKLDVSVYLTKRLSTDTTESQHKSLLSLELKHLLDIACRSPDMAWWQRPGKFIISYALV
jgi:nucleolar pre-ribosomal-associated protein 1